MTESRGTGKYERLLARCKEVPPISTAVAHPCDDSALFAVIEFRAFEEIPGGHRVIGGRELRRGCRRKK